MFLVSFGISFAQAEKLITRESYVFAGFKSKIMFASRREASLFPSLTAMLGLRIFSKVLRAPRLVDVFPVG